MIVDGDVGTVVVPHHARRIAVLDAAFGQHRGRAGDESVHAPAGHLLVDPARTVVRVHRQGRGTEVVNRVAAPLILVGQPGAQAVDLRAPARQGQVPEHVIEGSVLQHHDHHVVDLGEVTVDPLAAVSSHDSS
jgi:hypothetical protein